MLRRAGNGGIHPRPVVDGDAGDDVGGERHGLGSGGPIDDRCQFGRVEIGLGEETVIHVTDTTHVGRFIGALQYRPCQPTSPAPAVTVGR